MRAAAAWLVAVAGCSRTAARARPDGAAAGAAEAGFPAARRLAAPAADAAPAAPGTRAEVEAAAAQQAAQELEARVIELQRAFQALERQRAGADDVRRRLDELEARVHEQERHAAGLVDGSERETSVVQFRDNGFVVRSPDDRFLLRPRVRLQTFYVGELASQGSIDATALDRSSFLLAHAEVILEGHAGAPAFEYRLQLDGAEPQPVKDAFVQWHGLRSVAVRAGQFKVPYGLQRQTWSALLEFVTISEAMRSFSLERDIGLAVLGRPLAGRLQYELAALNGAGNTVAERQPRSRVRGARDRGAVRPAAAGRGGHRAPHAPAVDGRRVRLLQPGAHRHPTAHGQPDRQHRPRTATATSTTWRSGKAASSCARSGAGPRCRRNGSAASRIPASPAPRATTGVVTCRRATSCCRRGCRSRDALAALTCRSTAPPPTNISAAARASTSRVSPSVRTSRGHLIKLQVDYSHLSAPDALSAPGVHRVRAAAQVGF